MRRDPPQADKNRPAAPAALPQGFAPVINMAGGTLVINAGAPPSAPNAQESTKRKFAAPAGPEP